MARSSESLRGVSILSIVREENKVEYFLLFKMVFKWLTPSESSWLFVYMELRGLVRQFQYSESTSSLCSPKHIRVVVELAKIISDCCLACFGVFNFKGFFLSSTMMMRTGWIGLNCSSNSSVKLLPDAPTFLKVDKSGSGYGSFLDSEIVLDSFPDPILMSALRNDFNFKGQKKSSYPF